jgi:diaminohydroxyphosphoribosylaminopyrimidine deaminase/5-amino-6-(5-phosphoribosylamino)uracil reductase
MDDEKTMQRAIRLGRRGLGNVEPNPPVGCVLVRGGQIVGEGFHRRFGSGHAEIHALAQAGRKANGATAYVSLEPCSHTGKTPPCTRALIDAGIQRVVIGAIDPNPAVRGRGVRALRRAGIDVTTGIKQAAADALIAPFAKYITRGVPWVIAKWAQTVDGAIATRTGDSAWISNADSRKLVHQLRARVDAIVVGTATAAADDPTLTARDVRVRRVARRVVLDPNLKLSLRSKLVQTAQQIPTSIATSKKSADSAKLARLQRAGVETLPLGNSGSLKPLLRQLAKQDDATNVLVEGGGRTLGAFFEQKLVDEVWVFVAPKLAIDAQAIGAIRGGKALRRIVDAQLLSLIETKRVGDDVLLKYRVGN